MKYIEAKNLVNANDQQYINIGEDEALSAAVWVKNEEPVEFMKRQEAANARTTNLANKAKKAAKKTERKTAAKDAK